MPIIPALHRRGFIAAAAATVAATAALPLARLAAQRPANDYPLHPEDFGARGDGASDDTPAFQALGKAVSDRGGGTIVLRRGAIYRIGRQTAGANGSAAYLVQPNLQIVGADGVAIIGNGATLKLNDGLHYGSFDPATGQRFDPPKGKFTDLRYGAAIGGLIEIRSSRDIRITGLTLDGNVDRLVVGGRWETDIQLHADGLRLIDVSEVTVADLVTRNNGLDGVYLRGRGHKSAQDAPDNIRLRNVRCARNGRQGMSIVGGAALSFEDCTFADTGQGPIKSAPGAGVDIEPNGTDWASAISFDRCSFTNNVGVGLLAAAGASQDIAVRGCTFWQGFAPRAGVDRGSNDAFWLDKQGVKISDCRVHGTVTHLAPGSEVSGTSFDDAVHPVHGRSAQTRPYLLANVCGTFTDCRLAISGDNNQGLVYATRSVTFRRCTMLYAGVLSSNKAAAFLGSAATLQDVTFSEAMPHPSPAGHYIFAGHPTLLGRVIVTGPHIRWGGKTGPIGNVAALPAK